MLTFDPVFDDYFHGDEETIGSCIKKIIDQWNDLKKEMIVTLERKQMKTEKKYLSIELNDDSKTVVFKTYFDNCYKSCLKRYEFKLENKYLRIEWSVLDMNTIALHLAQFINEAVYMDENEASKVSACNIQALAYLIATNFCRNGFEKSMWDITDNKYPNIIYDTCEYCDECEWEDDCNENEDGNKNVDLEEDVHAIYGRLDQVEDWVEQLEHGLIQEVHDNYNKSFKDLEKRIDCLSSTKDNMVNIMDDHEKRLKNLTSTNTALISLISSLTDQIWALEKAQYTGDQKA